MRITRSMSRKFTVFPNLPVEIRVKTWEEFLELRIVEVCQIDDGSDWWENKNPFYSPTPLPAVLSTSHESRCIALQNYPLSFPTRSEPPQIRFNPSIDTLFFPAWCWRRNIRAFEKATPPAVKDSIQRIAIETLVWYGDWEDRTINNQIRISKFKNLKELVLVERLPDFTGCGCCHEFDGPEKGVVSFREQALKEKWVNDCKREFKRIKESNPNWKEPEVRFVELLRDGELI